MWPMCRLQQFSISVFPPEIGDPVGTETRCKQLPDKLALKTSTSGLTAEARRRRRCWSKGRYRGCQPKAEEHRVPLLRGTCKACMHGERAQARPDLAPKRRARYSWNAAFRDL